MTDDDLLKEINDLLEDEDGEAIEADTLLIDSGTDSFGLTMLLVSIDDKYNLWTQKEMEDLDVTVMTPQDIIDLVRKKHDS